MRSILLALLLLPLLACSQDSFWEPTQGTEVRDGVCWQEWENDVGAKKWSTDYQPVPKDGVCPIG